MIIRSAKNGHKPIQTTIRLWSWEIVVELKDIIRIAPIVIGAWAYAEYWLIPNRQDLDNLLKSDSIKTVQMEAIVGRLDNADRLVEKQRLLDSIINAEYNNINLKDENEVKVYGKNKIKKWYPFYDYLDNIDERIDKLEDARRQRKNN